MRGERRGRGGGATPGKAMVRASSWAAALIATAASCAPALAHVAPWTNTDPPPPPVQFLIGVALMAVAGAVIVWQGSALAREALAQGREALAQGRTRGRPRPAGSRGGAARPGSATGNRADEQRHLCMGRRPCRRRAPLPAHGRSGACGGRTGGAGG